MKETARFKDALEQEKVRLEEELGTIGRRNPANPNDWEPIPEETGQEADVVDAAEQLAGYGDNAAVLHDLEIRYNEVLAALERIAQGTYGLCSVGGEEIEEDRLNADPAATTCKAHL